MLKLPLQNSPQHSPRNPLQNLRSALLQLQNQLQNQLQHQLQNQLPKGAGPNLGPLVALVDMRLTRMSAERHEARADAFRLLVLQQVLQQVQGGAEIQQAALERVLERDLEGASGQPSHSGAPLRFATNSPRQKKRLQRHRSGLRY